MVGKEATTINVKRAILSLIRNNTDQDFLLFYFSGHARPIQTSEGYYDIYLVTYDFDEQEVFEDSAIHISLRWLRDKLYEQSRAGNVLIILDCSYSGNIIATETDPYLFDLRRMLQEYLLDDSVRDIHNRSRAILTSTSPNNAAFESDGHGSLTGLLLSALQGRVDRVMDADGSITLTSLYSYLMEQMPAEQTPGLAGEFSSAYILARFPIRMHIHPLEESELVSQMLALKNQMSEMMLVIGNSRFLEKDTSIHSKSPLLSQSSSNTVNLFYCYAHEDKLLRDELEKHLRSLMQTHERY